MKTRGVVWKHEWGYQVLPACTSRDFSKVLEVHFLICPSMGSCSQPLFGLSSGLCSSNKFLIHAILGNNEHEKLTAHGSNILFVTPGENSLFLACLAHYGTNQFGKKSKVFSYSVRAKGLCTGCSVWMPQKYGWCVFMNSPVSSPLLSTSKKKGNSTSVPHIIQEQRAFL